MLDINKLPHISELPNIETNFKIFAGPGAGKTTWLIKHLKKVLEKSERLSKTKKIACITYTNVAAEEILNRLDCDKSRFSISTIHSFLYLNIVKPFSYLIAKDNEGEELFVINKLNGHEEHIARNDMIRRWIATIENLNHKSYNYFNFTENKKKLIAQLSNIDYSFIDDDVDIIFRKKFGLGIPKSNGELWIYKKKYWHDGILHHEDVLYFSYLIINKSPRVLEFVRNKFPYIFIDEFQDTTELQTWIIKKIAESETIVGVIGDLAQSIYSFTGAKRSDFENLVLKNVQSYKLDKNHRSTRSIINFLNHLRTDITQETTQKTVDGDEVKLLAGSHSNILSWIEKEGFQNTYILTRRNETIEEIKNQIVISGSNLLEKLYLMDSNSSRVKVLHSILMGFKFYLKGYFKEARKEVIRPLKIKAGKSISKHELNSIAIEIIDDLKRKETIQNNLFNYYTNLLDNLYGRYKFRIGSKITNKCKAKRFYESTVISDLLKYIKVDTKSEDTIRTIHSAKGTEFDNTLVYFEKIKDFKNYVFDCTNCLNSDEDDARIYYVGFSRAKRNLFISIPKIDEDVISGINKLNIEYYDCSR